MMQQKPACTEPGRWDQTPSADAPAEIILAYLRHCEACPHHSLRNLEEDLSMDLLLREACRDLDYGAVGGHSIRRDAPARRLRPRTTFVRIAAAAGSLVVLVAAFWMLSTKGPAEHVMEELAVAGDSAGLSLHAYDVGAGQLYVSRRVADASYGRPIPASGQPAEQVESVGAPHMRGSLLRITNPRNWHSIEVRVAEQLLDERSILLPVRVADSLRLDDSMSVFVEILSTGQAVGFAP